MEITVALACSRAMNDPQPSLDLWHSFTTYVWPCIPTPFSDPPALLSRFYAMFFTSFQWYLFFWATVKQGITVPGNGSSEDYTANAEAAFNTLQEWYNHKTGLYDTTGWWNSANCLTVLGDLAAVDPKVKSKVTSVLANSFVAAQNYNLLETKVVQPDFIYKIFYGSPSPDDLHLETGVNPNGFLNDYYDDEGWWALAWIQAYDITQNPEYLQAAVHIFEDMKKGATTPCGGIWWDKAQTYVNAIANELYLSVAAHLANRASNKQYYLSIAKKQHDWFRSSGMINPQNLINDGLTSKLCINNNGTPWSYNQGVILGALVELNKASPNTTAIYLALAGEIATAAIGNLGVNGVLHDPCEPSCGADGSQFKGIFMRNLQRLQVAAPDPTYLAFIASNARSIWARDRNARDQLSVGWGGPFVWPANASTQSSALDALVAAAAFQGRGITS